MLYSDHEVNAMAIELGTKARKLIEQRVKSGRYASADAVVLAAIAHLDAAERFGDFAPGEMDRLLAEGEESLRKDGPVPGEEVFANLRRRSARRRRAKSA